MNINTLKENQFYILLIDGELDASSSIILDNAFTEALSKKENKILVDCSRLNYISSAGLGVFMSYLQDFENDNISMVLYQVSDKVKNVFTILGLDSLIRIVANKEEAIALMN
ncbi:MAG TPA: STAS domain-containing protein [Cytophagaceae bacterium]|jgi:anti-sigma B factor antagonist|nr:STAS domain-containing protein [Cytophagaceae bacterium]